MSDHPVSETPRIESTLSEELRETADYLEREWCEPLHRWEHDAIDGLGRGAAALTTARETITRLEQERDRQLECERAIIESASSWARRAEVAEASLVQREAESQALQAQIETLKKQKI
jgi:hypothetical protein